MLCFAPRLLPRELEVSQFGKSQDGLKPKWKYESDEKRRSMESQEKPEVGNPEQRLGNGEGGLVPVLENPRYLSGKVSVVSENRCDNL